MITESVLLVYLTPEESNYIQGLLSSFEIEIKYRDLCQIEDAELPHDESVCLAVIHLDESRKKPELEIRQIRKMLDQQIPILILISQEQIPNIRDYLRAGADDYWVLPFDETAFIRFYILLEWGQAVVQYNKGHGVQSDALYQSTLWERILSRLQEGLRFFSPNYLSQNRNPPKGGTTNYPPKGGTTSYPPKGGTTNLFKTGIARKWERIRLLGSGGFGEVWLIRESGAEGQTKKENLAVAKIPHSSEMNIASLKSAAILKRLSLHPNVVNLIEVIKEDGKIILIQEYIEGKTMQELLEADMNQKNESSHNISWIREDAFLQLLDVMGYTHQHKIMHRDIKPENIMITPYGKLKLLDFGIARELSGQILNGAVVGSRPFMAPEQFMGKSCIASDVWALGVLFYLLATGYLPFYHGDEVYISDIITELHLKSPREMNPDLPEKLEAIILKALEKDIKKRYADAGEFRTSLLQEFPDFGNGKIIS